MRRILKWIALGAVVVLVVLTALLASLPLLLDSEWMKSAALRHLARATGGQWQVARLEFSWLPRPKISVQGASFSIPGSAQGKVEALTLTTALLPLLWSDVRLSHIALVAPDITVLVGPTPESTAPSAPFTVSDLRAALARVSRLKAVDLRSLEFTIERGRFTLTGPDQPTLTLSGISGQAANQSGRFRVQLSTASNIAQRIDVKVDLDPERFEGNVELTTTAFDLAVFLPIVGVESTKLHGLVSLRGQFTADKTPALHGPFEASASSLSIASGGARLDLQGIGIAGEAQWTDAGLRLVGKDVHTVAPAVQATAVLTFSPDWNQQRLEPKIQTVDLEAVKHVVLPWTTDTPQIEQYARMVTAGQLIGVEGTLQLDQTDQWQKAIEARGTLTGAAMTLKQPEIAIHDLSASLALVQGKLQAREVKAVSGNSSLHDGRVDLDFTTSQPALAATAQWRADLAQALAFTKRQLAARDRPKLDTLRELTGDARGSVALDGTFDNLQVRAQVDAIHAQASLEQLPWPVTITAAQARFDSSELVLQGLAGKLGDSAFDQCSGRITLTSAAQLQVSGCEADLALVQLFDWGSKRFALPDAVKGLRLLAGRARVQVRTLAGALAQPAKWTGDVTVTLKAVRLTHPELPGELRLDGGSVRGDLRSLTAHGVKVEVLDAALRLDGKVSDLGKSTPQVELQASGQVGEKTLAWTWDRAGLRDRIAQFDPFEARAARLRWPVNGGFEAAAELLFAGKTNASFDVLVQGKSIDVRKIAIQDELSNVQASIRRRKGVLEGSFSGTLVGTSLERIVHIRQSPQTRATGNLKYRLPLKQPRDFSANGTLRVNQLSTLGWAFVPMQMTFKSADITANGRTLRFNTSFSAEESNFDVSGTIRGTDLRYALDLDVKSDRVDLDRLLAALDKQASTPAEKQVPEQPTSWDLPIEGKVRLAIQALYHRPYEIKPVLATLDILPGRINFAVKEAKLCGIGMAGGGQAQRNTASLDVVLRARDIDPRPTLLCLTEQRTALTGRLDADAHFTGKGPYRELAQRMHGPFTIVARDGRVDQLTGLARILNLVNASELLRGKNLGLQASGFAYNKFSLRGQMEGSVARFDEILLDAQPFDMVAHGTIDIVKEQIDMSVAIAPLQVLNWAVKLVPFLGYVLGGGVYAVPVGVKGNLSDPQVVPVAPTAVAGSVLGVLERTLKTPFNLREALIPPAMQGTAAAAPTPAPTQPSIKQ